MLEIKYEWGNIRLLCGMSLYLLHFAKLLPRSESQFECRHAFFFCKFSLLEEYS